jgi:hypothetical protein
MSDSEVYDALRSQAWESCPNVYQVISVINRRREEAYEKAEAEKHQVWLEEQRQAEREGKLATQEDYDRLRKHLRERLASGDWEKARAEWRKKNLAAKKAGKS